MPAGLSGRAYELVALDAAENVAGVVGRYRDQSIGLADADPHRTRRSSRGHRDFDVMRPLAVGD